MSHRSGLDAGGASLKEEEVAGLRTLPLLEESPPKFGGAWDLYFHQRHTDAESGKARRLDYSNDEVRFQTYGAMLEAAGPLTGVRSLDAGCGFGDLAKILDAGGARVEAFDLVDKTIRTLKKSHPGIRWFTADVTRLTPEVVSSSYGLIVATEVLQYVDPATAIRSLFRFVSPGGRLVGCIPYSGCPIVKKTVKRYSGHYCAISIPDLVETLSSLPEVRAYSWRGAIFNRNQELNPYRLTPWYRTAERLEETPNRLHFVASRA